VQVKIFFRTADVGNFETLEKDVNEFLKDLPFADVVKTDVVAFPSGGEGIRDGIAVFIWIRGDAK